VPGICGAIRKRRTTSSAVKAPVFATGRFVRLSAPGGTKKTVKEMVRHIKQTAKDMNIIL
jgi:hypothetical protein